MLVRVLCADYETDLLFWVDTKEHVVMSSDLNGQKRTVLLASTRFLRHAVAITVFEVIEILCIVFVLIKGRIGRN